MTRKAETIGLLAARTLREAGQATVLATFERSFYLQAGNDLIAVGAPTLYDGPLNLRLRDAPASSVDNVAALSVYDASASIADLGITSGQRWMIEPGRLSSDHGLVIDVAKASIWQPRPFCEGRVDRLTLGAGLMAFLEFLLPFRLPEEGLIRLALPNAQPESLIERAASPAITRLRRMLQHAFWPSRRPATFDGITELIGLGPGLTPSGDDLLGGVLITCHRLGEKPLAARLAALISAAATLRTTDISQAHLQAATLGYAAAPLHDLLDAMIAADRSAMEETLDAVAKIGHSSGFDALSGIMLALQGFLGQQVFDHED